MISLSLLLLVTFIFQIQVNGMDKTNIFHYNDSWNFRSNGIRHVPMILKDPLTEQIIFVSGSLNSSSALQLDFEDERKSCVVPRELKYNSISKQHSLILGNGKVIVSVFNNMVIRGKISRAVFEREWIISIINPKNCKYVHVQVARAGESLISVLPYEDTFDVLIKDYNKQKGSKITKVVRYKDTGNIVEGFLGEIKDLDFLKVLVAKEFDPANGYYYIKSNRQQGKSIIKKLNSNFKIQNTYEFRHSKYLEYDSKAYSAEYGKFSICYFDQELSRSLQCLIINGDLKKKLTNVEIISNADIFYVNVVNFPKSGAALIFAVSHEPKVYSVYVQHILEDSTIEEPITLGNISSIFYDIIAFVKNYESVCIVILTQNASFSQCVKLLIVDDNFSV